MEGEREREERERERERESERWRERERAHPLFLSHTLSLTAPTLHSPAKMVLP